MSNAIRDKLYIKWKKAIERSFDWQDDGFVA
jgi:hypothetical protein